MSFRNILLFCTAAVLGFAASAQAQIGVYGVVTGERISGFTCSDPQNRCASNDGKERPYGGNFGIFYDWRNLGPARLGVDLRGGVTNANKSAQVYGTSTDFVRHYSAMAGPRVTFKTPFGALHPYVEVVGGYARYLDATTVAQSGQVQGLAGVDVKILPFLDFRAIEFGAGELFGSNSHFTESIGAGVVLHFPR
ncbi:MAG TPA: hypothetical protein VGN16_07240 [Acidobacteriaceae bacterium]